MAEIKDIIQLQKEWSKFLLRLANVPGVGVGYIETAGKPTQELSLIIMMQNKVAKAQLLFKQLIPEINTGALLMDNDNRALGLCCGGSGVISVFNSIENVMNYLHIRLNK